MRIKNDSAVRNPHNDSMTSPSWASN